jgi:hypothetical protein
MRFNILLLIVLTTNVIFAQSTIDAAQVEKADAALNELILKNKAREAAVFYSHEFMLTTSSGTFKNKEDLLKEISSTDLALEINATENVAVKVHGNTAVLTGVLHQKGIYKGKTFDAWLLVTDTWIRTVNAWQVLAGHASSRPKT